MSAKSIHIFAFLFILLVAIAYFVSVPKLHEDAVAAFGTVSGFVTIYGVLFTIIELLRTKAVANIAADAATRAAQSVEALYGMENLSECQSCIEFALSAIDGDGFVSSSALSRIVKLYVATFPAEYSDANSRIREKVAMVESYTDIDAKFRTPATGRLRKTLVGMMADLSVSSGTRTARS